jgi:hypothetical protein
MGFGIKEKGLGGGAGWIQERCVPIVISRPIFVSLAEYEAIL